MLFIGVSSIAEEITLTTYYPAPYGAYEELDVGTLNVRDELNFEGLNIEARFENLVVGREYAGDEDIQAPEDSVIVEGRVGIGTPEPSAPLEISKERLEDDRDDLYEALKLKYFFERAVANQGSYISFYDVYDTPQVKLIGQAGSRGNDNNAVFKIQTRTRNNLIEDRLTIEGGDVGIGVAPVGGVRLNLSSATNDANSSALYLRNSRDQDLMRVRSDRATFIWGGLTIDGNLAVTGNKAFVIDHPTRPGYSLAHSSLEGPEAGVYYRGESQLVNGETIIELPDYFEALARKENRTVYLTAKGTQPYLLSASEVIDNKFKVYGTKQDGKFFWEVKAIRSDIETLEVERLKKE